MLLVTSLRNDSQTFACPVAFEFPPSESAERDCFEDSETLYFLTVFLQFLTVAIIRLFQNEIQVICPIALPLKYQNTNKWMLCERVDFPER